MAINFKAPPRYQMLDINQTPEIEDERIVGWTIRVMMVSGSMFNVAEEVYKCQPGEARVMNALDVLDVLESILKKMDDERDLLKRCADELDQKLAMASINNHPSETPAV